MERRPSQQNDGNQIAALLFVTPDLEQISDHLNNGALEGLHPRLYGVVIRGRLITVPDGVIQAMNILTPRGVAT